ncbi:hypothetical protein AKJ16_DCAP01460 [Drosera capensis]
MRQVRSLIEPVGLKLLGLHEFLEKPDFCVCTGNFDGSLLVMSRSAGAGLEKGEPSEAIAELSIIWPASRFNIPFANFEGAEDDFQLESNPDYLLQNRRKWNIENRNQKKSTTPSDS